MQKPLNNDNEPIVIDKELRSLLPKLTSEQYGALERAILQEGCREPLVVWVNQDQMILLSGHNRLAICRQHKIEYRVVIAKNVTSRLDAIIWIMRDQLGKRNLKDFDRARIALQLEDSIKEQAKKNQLSGLKQLSSVRESSPKRINTRETIASVAGVSSNTISKVKFINENATETQIEQLGKGSLSINRVHQELKHSEKHQDLSKEIDRFIKKLNWAVKKEIIPIGNKLTAHSDDFSSEQKEIIISTMFDLREFLKRMFCIFNKNQANVTCSEDD